jgi:hypothetical protein
LAIPEGFARNKTGGISMSRDRLTVKNAEILKAIETLQRLASADADIADEAAAAQNDEPAKEADAIEKKDTATIGKADADADLAAKADAISKADMAAVNQSTSTDVTLKDQGDQNAKANANWPLTEAEREHVASQLIKLAESLIN